jgi:hypothetical protein
LLRKQLQLLEKTAELHSNHHRAFFFAQLCLLLTNPAAYSCRTFDDLIAHARWTRSPPNVWPCRAGIYYEQSVQLTCENRASEPPQALTAFLSCCATQSLGRARARLSSRMLFLRPDPIVYANHSLIPFHGDFRVSTPPAQKSSKPSVFINFGSFIMPGRAKTQNTNKESPFRIFWCLRRRGMTR